MNVKNVNREKEVKAGKIMRYDDLIILENCWSRYPETISLELYHIPVHLQIIHLRNLRLKMSSYSMIRSLTIICRLFILNHG